MSNTKETLKQTILKLADASAKGAAAKARMRILKPAINGDAELMDAYYEAGVEMSLAFEEFKRIRSEAVVAIIEEHDVLRWRVDPLEYEIKKVFNA